MFPVFNSEFSVSFPLLTTFPIMQAGSDKSILAMQMEMGTQTSIWPVTTMKPSTIGNSWEMIRWRLRVLRSTLYLWTTPRIILLRGTTREGFESPNFSQATWTTTATAILCSRPPVLPRTNPRCL